MFAYLNRLLKLANDVLVLQDRLVVLKVDLFRRIQTQPIASLILGLRVADIGLLCFQRLQGSSSIFVALAESRNATERLLA